MVTAPYRPPVIAYIDEWPFNLKLRGPVPHVPASRARAAVAPPPVADRRPSRPPGGRAGWGSPAPVR